MKWQKTLWGVEFLGSMKDDKPMLVGCLWHDLVRTRGTYTQEPTRALVFQTREAARDWCRAQLHRYADRDDCCGEWRFRPIRVIETVRPA